MAKLWRTGCDLGAGRAILGALPFLASLTLQATPFTPKAELPSSSAHPPAVAAPTMLVADGQSKRPLSLAKLEVEATITGLLARTRLTMTFRNDAPRVLEGELVFPLPDDATVSGYALDIDGELVDGSIVTKKEARIAFEKEVRRGVDPGLVEWVAGNAFRTRVWPIPAAGTRTVRVEYVSPVETRLVDGREAARYRLPLTYREPIASVDIRVEVDGDREPPEVHGEALGNLRFERWRQTFVAKQTFQDFQPAGDLVVALPEIGQQLVIVERGEDGGTYFVVHDRPSSPQGPPPPRRSGRVLVLWDASLSAERADRRRLLTLLEAWALREGDVDVDFVAYRNTPDAPIRVSVRSGDARGLVALAEGASCDGGTSLASLRGPLSDDRYAYALLFGDGLQNIGGDLSGLAKVPVHAMSASSEVDRVRLRSVAESSGGTYVDLLSTDPADAVRSIGADSFGFLGASFDPAGVADVSPQGARPLLGRLMLTGRLIAPKARLVLRYGGGGAPLEERLVELDASQAGLTGLVPRAWAEQQVARLAVEPEVNHDAIQDLGRRFSLVTPGTSLLVLETLQQYLEHGVEPPMTRPAMRAEYLDLVEEQKQARRKAETEKLDSVAEMWARRVQWWEADHAKAAPDSEAASQRQGPRSRDDQGGAEERREASLLNEVVALESLPEGEVRLAETGADVEAGAGFVGDAVTGTLGGVLQGSGMPPPPPPAAPAEGSALETTKAADEAGSPGGVAPVIVLKPWDPETPYLTRMRAAGVDAHGAYLAERKAFGNSPAFFLDCGDFFLTQGQKAEGVRVLTSIVELGLEDARLYRIAAHRLEEAGEIDLAIDLFEKVLRLRPEEPQSLRDLALAYGVRADAKRRADGRATEAVKDDLVHAVRLLYRVVTGAWDGRFPEIEVTALMDLNRLASILEANGNGNVIDFVDPRLRKHLPMDLRVVMTWDTDMTDMDLWVTEPTGEKCFYSHPSTAVGGMISRDFTSGYGPEEYLVRNAPLGDYRIEANFYGSRSQALTGPTTVRAVVVTDFGRSMEKRQSLTLRLTESKEVVVVGAVQLGGLREER